MATIDTRVLASSGARLQVVRACSNEIRIPVPAIHLSWDAQDIPKGLLASSRAAVVRFDSSLVRASGMIAPLEAPCAILLKFEPFGCAASPVVKSMMLSSTDASDNHLVLSN
jgi:hypothetical protein